MCSMDFFVWTEYIHIDNRIHNVVQGISPIQCNACTRKQWIEQLPVVVNNYSYTGKILATIWTLFCKELVGIIVTDLFCLGMLFVNHLQWRSQDLGRAGLK